MKICYIAHPEFITTLRFLQFFVNQGHELTLLTRRSKIGIKIPKVKVYSLKPVLEKFFVKLNWRFYQFRRDKKLKRIIKKINPDIIQANYVSTNGWWGARSRFHPYVLFLTGSDIYRDPMNSAEFTKRVSYALQCADLIVSPSEDLKKHAVLMGADPSKITVFPIGVDRNEFRPAADRTECKRKLGFEDAPVVLSNRSFQPLYNIDLIIKCIPKVLEQITDAKFIFCSVIRDEEGKLISLAKELGIYKNMRFLGRVDYEKLVTIYNAADVFVSVPKSDGIPSSLLEAMACGTAPVVSDLPSIREWIMDGVNGLIVPIRDGIKTAEAIIYLLKNRDAREDYARVNQQIVKERGDYHKNMQKLEELYFELLNKSKTSIA